MKAQRLTLSNFRGFTQLELTFDPQLTILAGVNGSGKSGVLKALAALLSHLLREAGASREKPNELSVADIHVGKSAFTISGSFSSAAGLHKALVTHTRVELTKIPEYTKRRDEARFALRGTRKGSPEASELDQEIRYLSDLLHGDKDQYSGQLEPATKVTKVVEGTNPIAVLYTTSRYLDLRTPKPSGVRAFEPANAYTKALHGAEVSMTHFADWFRVVEQGAVGSNTDSVRLGRLLNMVVKKLLPGFSDPQLTEGRSPRFLVKKGRATFELGQLSDGERGLLALAFDLTRRLAIANPGLKNPVSQGSAIVLLDEIELHLHPSWQRQIMRRLTETFKSCQFIATTHSPQVIGQVNSGCLRLLCRDEAGKPRLETVSQSFGMDSNWVLQEIMDAPVRDYETERRLASARLAIDAGHHRKARGIITKLRKEVGAFPALQTMQSMLDRFEILRGK